MHFPVHAIDQVIVLTAPHPTFKERLAATELRRGLVQLGFGGRNRLGELPGVVVADGELRCVLTAGTDGGEQYEIATLRHDSGLQLTITGGEQGLLYGVFDFLERQGAYFGIDGEYYPLEHPPTLELPEPGQPWQGQPRLATRGLLPWPDFLNCITVFNREDHRAYLEAMLRMRFNTLGIHVYGQQDKWAESFLSFEYGGVGHYAVTDTTATDRWGYLPQRTSRYGMGAAQYFDGEVFGSDATRRATSPWEAAELAQALWREAFAYAEQLGIRTGVGFEPYQLPDEILRACPPEVRVEHTHHFHGKAHRLRRLDPESRTARTILETRLNQLLEAYPSVSHVWLWEDEFMNWASQELSLGLSVTPFRQAYDFLRRHAPDKRLVLAGWGGVVRNFEAFHRALPEDVIFSCLSDQLGWDPVHEVFGKLEGRERWPIPWIEDDPSMWFPQFHVNRFARDLELTEEYGCQGVLGIHWRHRIVDPVAGYLARRCWDAGMSPAEHYRAYAGTQAVGDRATDLAVILAGVDSDQTLLSTWTGEIRPDGHARHQEFSGDYSEAFLERVETNPPISDTLLESQLDVIRRIEALLGRAELPLERERLGYLYNQIRFLDPYARAWRAGAALHTLLAEQRDRRQRGEGEQAAAAVRAQGLPLWMKLLEHTRVAVLAFQHSVATRNDLGTLASIHNKFVRIATFRLRASLLEFLDELPPEAEEAAASALAPDSSIEGSVFVPTRPTRLAPGQQARITAIAPGSRELSGMIFCWRPIGARSWERTAMQHARRRTYITDLHMPLDAELGIEYVVQATFAGFPAPLVVTAPPGAGDARYIVTT